MRTKKIIRNVILILILIVVAFAGGFLVEMILANKEMNELEQEHNVEIESLTALIPTTVPGYVLSKNLTAGKEITTEDIIKVSIDENQLPPSIYSDDGEIIGKRLKINASIYTPITSELLYSSADISDDLREQQFSFIKLPDKLISGDTVDIRIQFPTGQDYVLLSKKLVTDLDKIIDSNNTLSKATVWMNMSEEETLRMSSAIVDAFLHGSTLYAIEYIEPFLQEPAEITYPQNSNVLKMIANDPTLLDIAKYNLEHDIRMELDESLIHYSSSTGQRIQTPSNDTLLTESPSSQEAESVVDIDLEAPIETTDTQNVIEQEQVSTPQTTTQQTEISPSAADAFGN